MILAELTVSPTERDIGRADCMYHLQSVILAALTVPPTERDIGVSPTERDIGRADCITYSFKNRRFHSVDGDDLWQQRSVLINHAELYSSSKLE